MISRCFFRFFFSISLLQFVYVHLVFAGISADQFAISMYHWNIQYVSGSQKTEDAIVIESFQPILDLYEKHPTWQATFEMQGYMVETLALRHPKVLDQLKRMVVSGQIELVSGHYSDQIVLAYPYLDSQRSMEINDKVFQDHGLPLSTTFFLQEDAFGEGVVHLMKAYGRKSIVVMGGLNQYVSPTPSPVFRFQGVNIVAREFQGPQGPAWVFVGDAELAATGKYNNPYFTHIGIKSLFKSNPGRLQKFESYLSEVSRTRSIISIEKFVEAMSRNGPFPEMPTILDKMRGDFTDNVWLWMGDNRNPFAEDDQLVRSQNSESRKWVLAAEKVVDWLQSGNFLATGKLQEMRSRLEGIWKTQLLAEVSDASGMGFPFPIEVEASLEHSRFVVQNSKYILDEAKKILDFQSLYISTSTGEVTDCRVACKQNTSAVFGKQGVPVERGPIKVHGQGILGGSAYNYQWFQVEKNLWKLKVNFLPLLPRVPFYRISDLSITFPRFNERIQYSPALLENEIRDYPLEAFRSRRIYLPLSNGLIGIGNNFFVIKNNAKNHLAVKVDKAEPSVSFHVRSPPFKTHHWEFYVFQGSPEEALELANHLNVWPDVVY